METDSNKKPVVDYSLANDNSLHIEVKRAVEGFVLCKLIVGGRTVEISVKKADYDALRADGFFNSENRSELYILSSSQNLTA